MPTVDLEPYRAPRPHRPGAARNFDAVLEAAREVLTDRGFDAPLEDVAERAGAGIATLYRSFPTRADEPLFRASVHYLDERCSGIPDQAGHAR